MKLAIRYFIVHEADRMLKYSANALLKTFEERRRLKPKIILLSHAEHHTSDYSF